MHTFIKNTEETERNLLSHEIEDTGTWRKTDHAANNNWSKKISYQQSNPETDFIRVTATMSGYCMVNV